MYPHPRTSLTEGGAEGTYPTSPEYKIQRAKPSCPRERIGERRTVCALETGKSPLSTNVCARRVRKNRIIKLRSDECLPGRWPGSGVPSSTSSGRRSSIPSRPHQWKGGTADTLRASSPAARRLEHALRERGGEGGRDTPQDGLEARVLLGAVELDGGHDLLVVHAEALLHRL